MTLFVLLGYIPLVFALLCAGVIAAARGNHSAEARALGDRVGRRSGVDRRQGDLAFVGTDRRSGVERRAAEADQAERAA